MTPGTGSPWEAPAVSTSMVDKSRRDIEDVRLEGPLSDALALWIGWATRVVTGRK